MRAGYGAPVSRSNNIEPLIGYTYTQWDIGFPEKRPSTVKYIKYILDKGNVMYQWWTINLDYEFAIPVRMILRIVFMY